MTRLKTHYGAPYAACGRGGMTMHFTQAVSEVTCLRCLYVMPLLHDERMARIAAVKAAATPSATGQS